MTDCGPPAMLDGPLRFQLSRWSAQMYVCFLSTSKVNLSKVNLCFSNENAMTDFRKTWYVLHEVYLGPWYLQVLPGISSCFEKVLPHCFKIFSCVHSQIIDSFAYYQLHRNKSRFLDYISRVIFEKRNKLNCGDLTISCLHDA